MQIHKQKRASLAARDGLRSRRPGGWVFLILGPLAVALVMTACKKDVASEVIDSDANGYLCLKCGARLYTPRTVFIGPQCPKCQQESLMDVVGYLCEKDQHLTIRPRREDRQPLQCERCQGPLVNAMRSPREKDLKAWGAEKTSS